MIAPVGGCWTGPVARQLPPRTGTVYRCFAALRRGKEPAVLVAIRVSIVVWERRPEGNSWVDRVARFGAIVLGVATVLSCCAALIVVPEVREILGLEHVGGAPPSATPPAAEHSGPPTGGVGPVVAHAAQPAESGPRGPARTVRNYWRAVGRGAVDNAWYMLSPAFQQRRHGGDSTPYIQHWLSRKKRQSICSIETRALETRVDSRTAVVDTEVRYRMGNGCPVRHCSRLSITLSKSPHQQWLIDKVARGKGSCTR